MSMEPKTILVVDDEESLLLTLVANLELEGYQVIDASRGDQALQIVKSRRIDLVLSDIRMPGMDGVELARQIHAIDAELPVMLMTAFAVEGLVDCAIREGAFTVLPKPFEVPQVLQALATAIRRPTVLIVDDDQPVAESTAAALSVAGVRARAVLDGESAVELLRSPSDSVDVCVVDMVMPGLSGPELIERIAALDRTIACIAVSGHDVPNLFRRAASGAFTIMRKPIAPEELLRVIAKVRGRRTA
jgi:DNA-binding NtrC family response regulator